MITKEEIMNYVKQMTRKEKIAQLFQIALCYYQDNLPRDFTGPLKDFILEEDAINNAGSVIGAGCAEELKAVQEKYIEKNRLQIPTIVMSDVIHGYKTIFPIPIGLSCSWNPLLMEETCQIAAKEAAVSGIHATFAPMVDLVRDPRWGRVMEATGEDPYLDELFAAAAVKGFQGNDLTEEYRIASCVKHFAGYGAPEAGREYNTVDISKGMLREYYLGAYKAAIEEGCCMVMTAFNTINRVPSTCNRWLLQDILRKEWEFDGVVISDWNSIDELVQHSVAENGEEAAEKAFTAGVDIDMMSGDYIRYLEEIIQKKPELEKQLDQSAERILELKNKLGLFEKPTKGVSKEEAEKIVLCEEHREAALRSAKESLVLLKNDGILPIDRKEPIVLAGSFAQSKDLMGSWSAQGESSDCISVKEGFENLGFPVEMMEPDKHPKTVIIVAGESQEETGESTSKTELLLKKEDRILIRKMKEQGIAVVLVVLSGRPLILSKEAEDCAAIVQAWFPGTEGGSAIAQLLTGFCEPMGRLTMSFPRSVGQIPIYYNYFRTGRPQGPETKEDKYVSKYIDSQNSPLFPFGFGLSYTEFTYSEIELSKETFSRRETIKATVTVTNSGTRAGTEVVQFYLCDKSASVVRPVMELKAFQKIIVNPGETEKVDFIISEEVLKFWDANEQFVAEPGEFKVMIGKNAGEFKEKSCFFTDERAET